VRGRAGEQSVKPVSDWRSRRLDADGGARWPTGRHVAI